MASKRSGKTPTGHFWSGGKTDCTDSSTARRNRIHFRASHFSSRPEEYCVIEMAVSGSRHGITGLSTSIEEEQMCFRLLTASLATMIRLHSRIMKAIFGYLRLKGSTDFVIMQSLHLQESKVC